MSFKLSLILFFLPSIVASSLSASTEHHRCEEGNNGNGNGNAEKREVIEVKGGPEDVVWVVQLSDLHFSVHHPERGLDFEALVGPALSIIKPSLVLVTGDLTDGKSKDLLTMKQNEEEWIEYKKVMNDVVKRSGLSKNVFYDLRGNHDNFGVSSIGGPFDFFSKYSVNGQLGRTGLVNGVTLQAAKRKLLFVGFDSMVSVGLRGPTNLFGHPTSHLLKEISSELSQWDSDSTTPVTKISFGHFPLSFSASSVFGETLKDIFLRNSLSVYLCGHLHTRFGKNLKRHHDEFSQKNFQLNSHMSLDSKNGSSSSEFWELEMGDWRKSRAMRILAIDGGFVSFLDTDLLSSHNGIIILPTFPVDSRFIPTSLQHLYTSQLLDLSIFETIRALVFSVSPIASVVARIYDSRPGNLILVLEEAMRKNEGTSRGTLYMAPWNYKAFEDTSPDRYWLQIETIDAMGKSTLSELKPFSINGISAKFSWTWKDFFVMGCQWDALYYPILWSSYLVVFLFLIIPKATFVFSNQQYTYRNFSANKGFMNAIMWALTEHYKLPLLWIFILAYLLYLILCPWLSGQVFTDGEERGYMTYKGWVLKSNHIGKLEFIGFPDIMVVVLPHILLVVFPAILVIVSLAAEAGIRRDYLLSLSGKGKKDGGVVDLEDKMFDHSKNRASKLVLGKQLIRSALLLLSLSICYKHYQNCSALVKAYEMNPFIHFPVYCFSIPLLLAYTIYKTKRV